MGFKVVLTSRVLSRKDIEEYQQKLGAELITISCDTEDDIIVAAKDADAVVTLMQPYTRRVIENLKKCKLIYKLFAIFTFYVVFFTRNSKNIIFFCACP